LGLPLRWLPCLPWLCLAWLQVRRMWRMWLLRALGTMPLVLSSTT
jgi:hypothetical protein